MDYQEKLRLAKEALDSGSYDKETIEYIFPELRESEDEKIKNFMIKVFKSYQNPSYHINTDKWEGMEISKILTWLEKQGKNNTDNDTQFEKQGEQESTDKIEPKFKVGDWIINPKGTIAHVNDVKKDFYGTLRYYIEFSNGNKSDPMPCFVDCEYRLWTIQDAKDGEVLAYPDNTIVLFKTLHKGEDEGVFTVHCLYLDNKIEGMTTCAVADIHPSTKAQHDLLFQKMKEAGYEWDAEKKELKKIEQTYSQWTGYDEKAYEIALLDIDKSPSITKNDTIDWLKSLKERMKGE